MSEDIDEHSAAIQGWDLNYNQISAGPFKGELFEYGLGWMQIIRDKTNQSMVKKGAAPAGSISFSFPVNFSGNLYCSGNLIPSACVLSALPENLPELKLPNLVDVITISISSSTLERELELHGVTHEILRQPKLYQLKDFLVANRLKETLELFEKKHDWMGTAIAEEIWRNEIRDLLLWNLLDALPSDQSGILLPSARKLLVDRACEYALTHLEEPLSILSLCRKLGASRRKLQYCFQETLGINAVAYLRALRLNAVRRDLRLGTCTMSVQDVASRWGFSHMSRFSREYREMFGELPSRTLQR